MSNKNKDEHVHRFAVRGELLERERERRFGKPLREREREKHVTEKVSPKVNPRVYRDLLCKYKNYRLFQLH